jgi:hypothetical protein
MGAALSYARRYALFTLVGIAGEDDLDAPDLHIANGQHSGAAHQGFHEEQQPGKSHSVATSATSQLKKNRGKPTRLPHALLTEEDSKALRDRLIFELEALSSPDDLTDWAHRILPSKNQMTAADRREVEAAFALKVASHIGAADFSETPGVPVDQGNTADREGGICSGEAPLSPGHMPEVRRGATTSTSDISHQIKLAEDAPKAAALDSVVVFSKPLRRRDREHLKFIGTQPCLACGRQPSDAHHLKFAQQVAMGRKVSDEYAVPLCRHHHRELHRRGDERIWWRQLNIDPLPAAERLWQQTQMQTRAKPGADAEG